MNLSSPTSKNRIKPSILVILGPTASGKSALAVKLAKRFNGEVISADSRQIYKGMDLGTGKITRKEMRGVRHYLIDVSSPKNKFDVVQWKKLADKAVADIARRGKLPIVCGGTGLYIKALIENVAYPDVPPDWKLRKKLDTKSAAELFAILKKLDLKRAHTIDPRNPRRLVRAIEIAKALGGVPALSVAEGPRYHALIIGVKKSPRQLQRAISKRINERIKKGMIAEAKCLQAQGVSFKRMEEIGLEYKYLALHLQGKMNKKEMREALETKIWQYARRQMTWFRKTKQVHWIRTYKEAEMLVSKLL